MGGEAKPWPPHGHAVNARNQTGDNMVKVMKMLDGLVERARQGEVTRVDVTLTVTDVRKLAMESLILMIQQGYEIHPSIFLK
ncbi:MAG: hypothetical protein IPM39_23470 [Chloroflexi bacterium]|nr:hypothetical protein [Chloroflexota bacterium]